MTNVVADEAMKKMWYASTAKRIDAIGEKKNELWIIEVASSPYLRAVGQCLSYKFLWEEDPKIDKPARMILLCPYIGDTAKGFMKGIVPCLDVKFDTSTRCQREVYHFH